MRVLIGGVGYRFQGDLSFGLHVSDALGAESVPADVEAADLGFGAIFVAQDLAAADPPWDRVVLVAAAVRGREPGLYETGPAPPVETVDAVQERIREAGAGVIDLDHLLVIGSHFGAFPPDLRVLELEPVDLGPGAELSATARDLVPEAIRRARALAVDAAPAWATARGMGDG